ncbi:2-polyprenyl-6-hydroxyphenol methylase [Saliniradius amylolyticus]|uniref:Ubiquinone biosynthesis O-methyltransferase n=1 Tax=Saliniradius amylolyticus TaxID=2183582 RepID=A0A2S2E1E5_9ALTE|nr:bifunctional 2-polyprenyl-6-hydroxyphenol methylase/3-demethylubiquinol 3-O-methyltransferase UbiG [Saliniradius amylolyticus]AWL11471.1 2-polyprenyl-6-hydroxyphenol methylase [Saliniradius amylolyticus]
MINKSQLSQPISDDNISNEEIARFDAMAESWWDPEGSYKTAIAFNQARTEVMLAQIQQHFGLEHATKPLEGVSILDVGCGGGLVSETLALKGAQVTGIDASAVSIQVARRHAKKTGVSVNYQHALSSDMAKQHDRFDVVINAEVVEHVPDQKQLIRECSEMVHPGGMLILATLNRTVKSFIIAILGAEYVMRYLPIGTHDWRLFVKPAELNQWTGEDMKLTFETGMRLNPFSGQWRVCQSTRVNYLQCYRKLPGLTLDT